MIQPFVSQLTFSNVHYCVVLNVVYTHNKDAAFFHATLTLSLSIACCVVFQNFVGFLGIQSNCTAFCRVTGNLYCSLSRTRVRLVLFLLGYITVGRKIFMLERIFGSLYVPS